MSLSRGSSEEEEDGRERSSSLQEFADGILLSEVESGS